MVTRVTKKVSAKKKKVNKLQSKDPLLDAKPTKKIKVTLGALTLTSTFGGKTQKRTGRITIEGSRSNHRYGHANYNNCTCGAVDPKDGASYHFIINHGATHVGSLSIGFKDGIACMSGSYINSDIYKGMGIGKKSYLALAKIFGVIESDPNANTSADATRVWKSIKAKKINKGKKARYRYVHKD